MYSGIAQLTDWMERRGFTQTEASRFLGFTEPYMSKLMSGKGGPPRLANAIHIERLTGISVEAWADVLDESQPRQPAIVNKSHVANE